MRIRFAPAGRSNSPRDHSVVAMSDAEWERCCVVEKERRMQTFTLLKEAIVLAESLGYSIRHEWLGGAGGGSCEIAGRKWLFVDLALNPLEQLDQLLEALRADPQIYAASSSVTELLRDCLDLRRSA